MLIKRNLLVFFRDRSAVFFSLLAVFIMLGLYILFLGSAMEEDLSQKLGLKDSQVGVVTASLTLSGIISVTCVTGSMGAMGIFISDKEKAGKDFLTSPISRNKLTAGYMFSGALISAIMSFAALIFCLVFIVAKGGHLPDIKGFLGLLLTTVLSVLCGSSIVFFITCFVSSEKAYASLCTVVGTLIGFLIGAYIPIGVMPDGVQWVIKCFPMSHSASMYKQILTDNSTAVLFKNAPSDALGDFRSIYGIHLAYGSYTSQFWLSALILAGTAVIFYSLSLKVLKKKS